MTSPEEAREQLRQAHIDRASAASALDAARLAAERARAFVEEAKGQRDALREVDQSVAIDRSQAIKSAILSGSIPMFAPVPGLSANAAALSEAENRLNAAEIACADIEASAGEAACAATAADEELRAAVQAVALAIAHEMAAEAEALESRALELRVRIGGAMGAVGQFPVLTDSLRNVVSQTDDYFSDRFLRDGRLWNARKHADEVWRPFIGALIENPDALLDFTSPVEAEAKAA